MLFARDSGKLPMLSLCKLQNIAIFDDCLTISSDSATHNAKFNVKWKFKELVCHYVSFLYDIMA